MSQITVLGIGNLLQRDEGFGVHAVRILKTQAALWEPGSPGEVEYLDGGALGLSLLPVVEDSCCLLVLDAIDAGQPPGTLIEIEGKQTPLYSVQKLSEHQVGFQEVLALARFRQRLPDRLRLVGAQPCDLSTGIGLSPVLQEILPAVVQRAAEIVSDWQGVDQGNQLLSLRE